MMSSVHFSCFEYRELGTSELILSNGEVQKAEALTYRPVLIDVRNVTQVCNMTIT